MLAILFLASKGRGAIHSCPLDITVFERFRLVKAIVNAKLISNGVLVFLADAFGRVIFTHLVADTRVIWETRSPTWDQMLVFKDLILWGDVNEIAVNPPTIVIEVFDKDIGVSQGFLVEISNLPIFNMDISSSLIIADCHVLLRNCLFRSSNGE